MTDIETVIEVLEYSVKWRGEVPLTNKHLLNILRMAQRAQERREYEPLEPLDMPMKRKDADW